MVKRKYDYPTDLITNKGVLNKNKLKQIYKWRENINKKKLTEVLIENYNLKKTIECYQDALEEWVLIAQKI